MALSESRLISASLDSTIYVRSFRPADQACGSGGDDSDSGSGSDSSSDSDSGSSAAELDSVFASSGSSDAGSELVGGEGWSEDDGEGNQEAAAAR